MGAQTWTDEQTRLAQNLYASGASPATMARIIGRSASAIQTHLSRHKTGVREPVARVFSEWTEDRNERLVSLVIAGKSISQVAVALGASESAVQGQAYRLGVFQKQLVPAVRERIVELAREGATLGRISRQTGVPEPGVRFVLSRAGVSLRAPTLSYRGPDARRAGR